MTQNQFDEKPQKTRIGKKRGKPNRFQKMNQPQGGSKRTIQNKGKHFHCHRR